MSTQNSTGQFSHLYWIGGSPCGGKSTITETLAAEYGLGLYRMDKHVDRLMERITEKDQPALSQWAAQSWDQRWMQAVDALLSFINKAYNEEFAWCLNEILEIPAEQPTIVEGNPLQPALVQPYLTDRRHAIWLIAQDEDLENFYARRTWIQEILKECTQPETAFSNWMAREIRFAHQIRQACEQDQLFYLMSDPGQTINEKAEIVANHFQLSRAL